MSEFTVNGVKGSGIVEYVYRYIEVRENHSVFVFFIFFNVLILLEYIFKSLSNKGNICKYVLYVYMILLFIPNEPF